MSSTMSHALFSLLPIVEIGIPLTVPTSGEVTVLRWIHTLRPDEMEVTDRSEEYKEPEVLYFMVLMG